MYHKKHGFTIIEISLVLAIAGLILVMAFVALPALQRQARDTKRKDDTMAFLQALKSYQQNNRGNLPSFINDDPSATSITRTGGVGGGITWDTVNPTSHPWAKFYNQYLGEEFKNSNGTKYTFFIDFTNNWIKDPKSLVEREESAQYADFYIFLEATCENGIPVESSNSRNVAILTKLETSSSYCADM